MNNKNKTDYYNLRCLVQDFETCRENLIKKLIKHHVTDRVYIWGSGKNGKLVALLLQDSDISLDGFFSTNKKENIMGLPVYNEPSSLPEKSRIIIAFNEPLERIKEIKDLCIKSSSRYLHVVNTSTIMESTSWLSSTSLSFHKHELALEACLRYLPKNGILKSIENFKEYENITSFYLPNIICKNWLTSLPSRTNLIDIHSFISKKRFYYNLKDKEIFHITPHKNKSDFIEYSHFLKHVTEMYKTSRAPNAYLSINGTREEEQLIADTILNLKSSTSNNTRYLIIPSLSLSFSTPSLSSLKVQEIPLRSTVFKYYEG